MRSANPLFAIAPAAGRIEQIATRRNTVAQRPSARSHARACAAGLSAQTRSTF